jgi:hypothetical protein
MTYSGASNTSIDRPCNWRLHVLGPTKLYYIDSTLKMTVIALPIRTVCEPLWMARQCVHTQRDKPSPNGLGHRSLKQAGEIPRTMSGLMQ